MSHLPAVTFFASKTKHSGGGREQLHSMPSDLTDAYNIKADAVSIYVCFQFLLFCFGFSLRFCAGAEYIRYGVCVCVRVHENCGLIGSGARAAACG